MKTVTLKDGRRVRSDSREWQIETLARYVLKMPAARRRQWLASCHAQVLGLVRQGIARLESHPETRN